MEKNREKEVEQSDFKKKADELKFNDKIDDKYTSNVLNKYEKGHQHNRWLVCSGVCSVLFGIACIVTMITVGIVFLVSSETLSEMSILSSVDFDEKKTQIIACCIAIPVMGILSIVVGVKVYSYSSYTHEMLVDRAPAIMFTAFIQFFVSAFIFALLTVIGYFIGRGMDYGAIYYNKIDKYDPSSEYLGNRNYYENGPFTVDEKPYVSKVEDDHKNNLVA